ncbi:MAG TPA: T9SS type A sorting domain-containing protein [Ignavibacteriaceae bacterium]|nr:MAG: hypothetical protein BWY38_01150 [Ignavibacteria bacterium ADurb.Bin266]HQI40797.1 T9SS type A sorting domain-containing protein [Ignavibacteriaceae bacterium]
MKFSSPYFLAILFLFQFLIPESILPQIPDTVWTKTFGGSNIDVGYCVQQTSDSGYVITGYTRSYGSMSGRNVLLIKTDKNGNQQWIKAYGGNADDEGYSVKQTTDGGYIIAGYTKSYGAGANDVYLVKTDASGNQLWDRIFGGSQDDYAYSVLQTSDGGFLLAGFSFSYGNGGDILMIKTNSNGNLVWQKTIGGISSDGAMYMSPTSDGGYILTGWTLSYGPGAIGNAFLVKTDSLGNQQWYNYFGGTDADRGYAVQQTTDGGYILTGYTGSFGAGLYDLLLIKTDSLGNQKWMKTFGGTGRDYGNSIQQTTDGGFIILGYTLSFGAGNEDFYLIKTDANGNTEWFKTLGGIYSEVGYFVRQTNDGGLILVGHTLSFGAGLHDVWLIKMENIIPVELVSFNAAVEENTVYLNWITATETNNQGFEIQRSENFGNEELSEWIHSEQEWNVIGFVPGYGTTSESHEYSFVDNLTLNHNHTLYYRLKQIDYDGSYVYSDIIEVKLETPKQFSLEQNYPNPFNPITTINFNLAFDSKVSLKIFNVLGQEIAVLLNDQMNAGQHKISFNASSLNSGVYFCRLNADAVDGQKFSSTRKMILAK